MKIETEYRLALSSRDANGQYWAYFERRFKTKKPRFNAEIVETQTSVVFSNVEIDTDESCQVSEIGLKIGYHSYGSNGNAIEINGLLPKNNYYLTTYAIYNGGSVYLKVI